MKRTILAAVLAAALLTGCGWMGGNYVSVQPHREQEQPLQQAGVITAATYTQLREALEELVRSGAESAVIQVTDYPVDTLEQGMTQAVRHTMDTYPLGAYAVENVDWEPGTSGGQPALAVNISYRYSWLQVRQIRRAADMDAVEAAVALALKYFEPSVALLVEQYEERDFAQFVQDYALDHPQAVMETPQTTVNTYGGGDSRVVELIFTYQNSRDSLRQMLAQVDPVFDAASLYVSGDDADRQKFAQLYGFLMERFDYTLETSITPAYSLLRHGVGDSRAFATVYAAMCRGAGLECQVVTGTRSGEPWTWNMVVDGGSHYHVDLLRCSAQGSYREWTDSEMRSYVWDYSAYPACTGVQSRPDQTGDDAPAGEAAEQTQPTQEALPTEEPQPTGEPQPTEEPQSTGEPQPTEEPQSTGEP